jgi:hypothetical protein
MSEENAGFETQQKPGGSAAIAVGNGGTFPHIRAAEPLQPVPFTCRGAAKEE